MYQLRTRRWNLVLYGERIVGGKWGSSHRIATFQATSEGWQKLMDRQGELGQRADYRNLTIGAVPFEPDIVKVTNYRDINELTDTTWIIGEPERARLEVEQYAADDEVTVRIVYE